MQTYNPEPVQDLWIAVLKLAKKDISSKSKPIREKALDWLESKHFYPGSFLWICDLFNLNPQIMIKQIIQ